MALKLTSHPFRPDTVALPQDWRCSGEAHQAERLRTECEASRRDGTIWRFKMNQPRSAVSLSLSVCIFGPINSETYNAPYCIANSSNKSR